MSVIEDKLKHLPENPGVYVMLDKDGVIIYVGKAKNLKNRVKQYFTNSIKPDKVTAMVKSVADFYYIIVFLTSQFMIFTFVVENLFDSIRKHYVIVIQHSIYFIRKGVTYERRIIHERF